MQYLKQGLNQANTVWQCSRSFPSCITTITKCLKVKYHLLIKMSRFLLFMLLIVLIQLCFFTWSSATLCDDGMRTFISRDCMKRCCEHLCFCSPADQLRPYYSVIKSAQIHQSSSRLFSLRNSVSAYVAPGNPLQCKKNISDNSRWKIKKWICTVFAMLLK